MPIINMTWKRYTSLINEIKEHLDSRAYRPELIFGIARGGLTPMVSLSSRYRTREIGVIFVQKTASDSLFSEMLPKARCFGYGIVYPVEGKSVLLVDNIIQTGESVEAAIDVLVSLSPKNVMVVSICQHNRSYRFDHYSPMMVRPDDWVVFPWDQEAPR